jgi:hypothetical protein
MYVPCVAHKFNAFAGTKATLTLHVAGALAVETCLSFGPWKPRSGPLRLDLKILHVMTILEASRNIRPHYDAASAALPRRSHGMLR